MQYRPFGHLGWKVSALGFGCMRLPTSDGKQLSPNIDEAETIRMLRHALDRGVNYVDTAYVYHGGTSEVVLGKALRDGYREKVKVATKLPIWQVNEPADFDKHLNEQLTRLRTDHIDCYLIHALNQSRWRDRVLKYSVLYEAARALADGRIRHLGFSFHDGFSLFEEIVEATDLWSFCQLQYNYMDVESQAGQRGVQLAASKGLAVVVMEPLLGGRLANPPSDVRHTFQRFPAQHSPAEWALEWLWDQPAVSVVLSGMSTMRQVEENLCAADNSRTHGFGTAELDLIARVRELYKARTAIPCTKCGYCMPCPNGVHIPNNFEIYNYAHLFDDVDTARFKYQVFLAEAERAGACIDCDACESECPQKIAISDWMPRVAELLA
jgi:predicted aldo/keto reductase-like oxidoreductase